jgi:hypothetical protein
MKKIFLIYITTLLLYSCVTKSSVVLKYKETKTLSFSDNEKHSIDYIQYYKYKQNNYLAILDGKIIHLFEANSISKYLSIDLNNISNEKIQGFFIQSLDSVFILTSKPTEILIANKNGEIVNKYGFSLNEMSDLMNKFTRKVDNQYLLQYYTSNYSPLLFKDNCLTLMNYTYDIKFKYNPQTRSIDYMYEEGFSHLGEKSNCYIFEFFNDSISEINNNTGIWPESYTDDFCYFINGTVVSRAIDNKRLIFSFPMDHNLYVYNKKGFIKKKYVKSKYIDSLFVTDIEKYKDPYYKEEKTATSNFYKGILYDEYHELFFRTVVHKQKYKNNDGTINKQGDNAWSLIILSKDLEIKGEVFFKEKTLNYNNIIPTENGLLIQKYNKNKYNFDYEFLLYEIKF